MLKVIIVICALHGATFTCLPFSETPVKYYDSMGECTAAGQKKADEMLTDARKNNVPVALIEATCVETNLDQV